MTVTTNISKITHDGNASAVNFPFPFKVYEKSHLRLVVTTPEGNEVEVLQADFSVTGLGEESGNVMYQFGGSPLPVNYKLTILRKMPFLQEFDVTNQSSLKPEQLERSFDIAAMERQELVEIINRGTQLPVVGSNGGVAGSGVTLPIGISDVSGLQTQLNSKLSALPSIAITDVTNLSITLSQKADISSLGNLATLNAGTGLTVSGNTLNVTGGGGGGGVTSFYDLDEITAIQSGGTELEVFAIDSAKQIRFFHDDKSNEGVASIWMARTADYAGGLGAQGVLKITNTVKSSVANNEFNIASTLENYSGASGGPIGAGKENAASFFTARHHSNGTTWGTAYECFDFGQDGVVYGQEGLLISNRITSDNRTVVNPLFARTINAPFASQDENGNAITYAAATADSLIYAYSLCDTNPADNFKCRAKYGYIVGDEWARNNSHGGAASPVNNAFVAFNDGVTAFNDLGGNKTVGLLLQGNYTNAAIRMKAGALISFNDNGTVTLRDTSGALRSDAPVSAPNYSSSTITGNAFDSNGLSILANGNIQFKGTSAVLRTDNGAFRSDASVSAPSYSASAVSGNVFDSNALTIKSTGVIVTKSSSIIRGSPNNDFISNGIGKGGTFLEVEVPINGVQRRRYLELFRHVNDS